MSVLDRLNSRFGRGTVRMASSGVAKGAAPSSAGWQMRQERRTPRYTTRWDELAVIGC